MTTPNPRPSFPTEEKHFHPFAALRFLRKTLAVYLIPLVNVLFERNWPAFWTALRQDAILTVAGSIRSQKQEKMDL